ncbi:hypothetical protein MRX96_030888 [Rhipicephalus microplus]
MRSAALRSEHVVLPALQQSMGHRKHCANCARFRDESALYTAARGALRNVARFECACFVHSGACGAAWPVARRQQHGAAAHPWLGAICRLTSMLLSWTRPVGHAGCCRSAVRFGCAT